MTISKHLTISVVVGIIFILILIPLWTGFNLRSTHESEKVIVYENLLLKVINLNTLSDEYVLHQYPRIVDQWELQYQEIVLFLEKNEIASPYLLYKLEDLKHNFSKLYTDFSIDNSDNKILIESENLGLKKEFINRLNTNVRLKSKNLLIEIHKIYNRVQEEKKKNEKYNFIIVFFISFIIIVLSVLNAVLIRKKIIPPLKELVDGASVIENGEYEYTFGISEKKSIINPDDEIGVVAISFNNMTMKLVSLIENLKLQFVEQEKVEKNLRIEKNNLEHILNSMKDGVSIVNSDYEIKYVNPALELVLGDIQGKKCYEYFHGHSSPCNWCKINSVAPGEAVQWEWTAEETGKTYDLIDTSIQNADGSISMLEISRDITERKKAEQEKLTQTLNLEKEVALRTSEIEISNIKLKKSQQAMVYLLADVNGARAKLLESNKQLQSSNKDLEAFSHTVSHDLRSPLRAVLGFTAKLERTLGDTADKETLRLMKVISEKAIRMQDLITDLLAYSRVSINNIKNGEINTADLVKSVLADFVDTDIKIKFTVLNLPNTIANYSMIRQVFVNLIDNAVKFSRDSPGPEIIIGYTDQYKAFYVKDNGCGFDSSLTDKVFGIFQRVTNDPNIEGTGVGLAIVKRIIESHHGRVWAESEPGKGTAFYFNLNNDDKD